LLHRPNADESSDPLAFPPDEPNAPNRRPPLGVIRAVQQLLYQLASLVRGTVGEELAGDFFRGQVARQVQVNAPQEFGIGSGWGRFDLVLIPVAGKGSVDGLDEPLLIGGIFFRALRLR
jgi:hypothetical protein